MERTIEQEYQLYKKGMIHFVLSHSYIVFFVSIIVGTIIDILIPIPLFTGIWHQSIGFCMILVGSGIIYWAQSASARIKRDISIRISEQCFEQGPYKYSRNPTHIGLSVMCLGLAFTLNSFFIIIGIMISSIVIKFIFLKKEESLLEKKFGQPYRDYKKKVSTWV